MKSMLKDAEFYSLIILVSGLLLGLVYQVTKDPIAVQRRRPGWKRARRYSRTRIILKTGRLLRGSGAGCAE